ncbi:MAG TPA: hypothetical protein VLL52_21155 [Anaerolineae bacterium]|nr:hypothetical protein [Anaerolineae bacterium]
MSWSSDKQARFDALRWQQLQRTLLAEEQAELDQLFAEMERDDALFMEPVLAKLEAEVMRLRAELDKSRQETEALAQLLASFSLMKVAEIGEVSWAQMRDIFLAKGLDLGLGVESVAEAYDEIEQLRAYMAEQE